MKPMKRLLSVLCLLLAVTMLFSACGKKKKGKAAETTGSGIEDFDLVSTADPTFDYYHSDLSSYLTISREDYLNLLVSLDVTDADVEEYINDYLLPSYRTPKMATDRAIEDKDKVYIYYTGYTDNFPFDNGSNKGDEKPCTFVIGSGDFFLTDVENQLIGKTPADTSDETPFTTADVVFPENHKVPKLVENDTDETDETENKYADPKLVGKTVRFKITIVGIVDGENLVTDRAILAGDTVSVYYTGYADDYAFSGGSNADDENPYELEIGSNSFIAGFESALIGTRPDETSKESPKTINVTFPEDYRNTDLAGKPARFDVVIAGIFDNGWIIPELTADFVTNKIKFETEEEDVIAALRADVKDWLRDRKVSSLKNHKLIRTMEELFKVLRFEDAYPDGEPERYEDNMYSEVIYYYQNYNWYYYMYYGYLYFEDEDDAGRWYYGLRFDADWRTYQHTEAFRVVRQTMVLNMIARLEGLTVTEEDAKAWVREQVQSRQEQANQQAEQTGEEAKKITPADVLAEISVEEIYTQLASKKAQEFILNSIHFDYGELPITD